MTKTIITLIGTLLAIIAISSCGTVQGIAQDVQSLGRSIKNSAR